MVGAGGATARAAAQTMKRGILRKKTKGGRFRGRRAHGRWKVGDLGDLEDGGGMKK